MFGFKQKKDINIDDAPSIPSPMEVLRTKCRVSTIGQSEYLIANDLDALNFEECSLLYKSWGDEFRKTSLFKKLLDGDLLYFSTNTPLVEEQFTRLNISQLHVLKKYGKSDTAPRATVYNNPLASSGLLLAYEHFHSGHRTDNTLVIMNSDKTVLLTLQNSIDAKHASNPDGGIMNFVPGPWLSTLSSDLDRIPEFKNEGLDGEELIKAQAQREMIYEAMKIN